MVFILLQHFLRILIVNFLRGFISCENQILSKKRIRIKDVLGAKLICETSHCTI